MHIGPVKEYNHCYFLFKDGQQSDLTVTTLEKDFAEGFKDGCKIILGIAVTRFNPVDVEVNKNIMAPNMSEEAVIEITGRGRGKSPLLTNYQFKKTEKRQLLLPFTGEKKEDFETLKDLICLVRQH